jgi:hypothetical protein
MKVCIGQYYEVEKIVKMADDNSFDVEHTGDTIKIYAPGGRDHVIYQALRKCANGPGSMTWVVRYDEEWFD